MRPDRLQLQGLLPVSHIAPFQMIDVLCNNSPRECPPRSYTPPHPSCLQTQADSHPPDATRPISTHTPLWSSLRPKSCPHLFLQETPEFVPTVLYPQPVRRVHDPDQGVRLLKVVPPVRPQRLLSSHVPCAPSSVSPASMRLPPQRLIDLQILSLYLSRCPH